MADVAQTELVQFDPIDEYEAGGKGDNSWYPPVEGKYFGVAPVITDIDFGLTRENYRSVTLDPIVVKKPDGTEYQIRFTRLSAKKYANRKGSQVLDFLAACGISQLPTSDDQMKELVKQASGRTFQFHLVWEAWNKDAHEATKGMENFPPDPQNPEQRLPYIVDPYDASKRWFANAKVKFFISAI